MSIITFERERDRNSGRRVRVPRHKMGLVRKSMKAFGDPAAHPIDLLVAQLCCGYLFTLCGRVLQDDAHF